MRGEIATLVALLTGFICFAYLVNRVVRKTVMDPPRRRVPLNFNKGE